MSASQWREASRRGRNRRAPAVTFASCTRVPKGKELCYAAELMGGEVRVRRCGNGVLVPDAEIVLEGYIGGERHAEGRSWISPAPMILFGTSGDRVHGYAYGKGLYLPWNTPGGTSISS